MTTNSEASEGESAPITVVLNWAAGLKKQARRHSERPTCNSPPGHFLVKLRRSRRQVSPRRKLYRAVDAQAATANSIPWSSTAKFSRNGVLVAPLRVSYAPLVQSSDLGDAGRKPRLRKGEPAVRLVAGLLQLSELTLPRSPYLGSVALHFTEMPDFSSWSVNASPLRAGDLPGATVLHALRRRSGRAGVSGAQTNRGDRDVSYHSAVRFFRSRKPAPDPFSIRAAIRAAR